MDHCFIRCVDQQPDSKKTSIHNPGKILSRRPAAMRPTCGTGFTLIEILISIGVLALGVIGAASMQLSALHASRQSSFQTVAIQLAAETADKMRANGYSSLANDAANPFLGVDFQTGVGNDITAAVAECYLADANCSAAEMAKLDIQELQNRVNVLPKGRVRICRDDAPWDSTAGTYRWACPAASTPGAPIVIKLGWQAGKADADDAQNTDSAFPPNIVLVVASHASN